MAKSNVPGTRSTKYLFSHHSLNVHTTLKTPDSVQLTLDISFVIDGLIKHSTTSEISVTCKLFHSFLGHLRAKLKMHGPTNT